MKSLIALALVLAAAIGSAMWLCRPAAKTTRVEATGPGPVVAEPKKPVKTLSAYHLPAHDQVLRYEILPLDSRGRRIPVKTITRTDGNHVLSLLEGLQRWNPDPEGRYCCVLPIEVTHRIDLILRGNKKCSLFFHRDQLVDIGDVA